MFLRINTSIVGRMRLFRNQLFAIACLLLAMYPQISNAEDWRCSRENQTALEETDKDAFYDILDPLIELNKGRGTVLRYHKIDLSDEKNSKMPAGHVVYRVLYVTTSKLVVAGIPIDMPVVASGLVTFPLVPDNDGGYTDIIKTGKQTLLITHGTTGINPDCGPSRSFEKMFISPWMHDANLKTAAPDYYGLGYDHTAIFRNPDSNYTLTSSVGSEPYACSPGMKPFENSKHPYVGAQSEARSSIDLVRAARNLEQIIVNPCDTLYNLNGEFAVVGASQGGHAALAVGELMDAGYATDLTLKSIVAGAPPSVLRIEEENRNLPMILVGYSKEFLNFTPSEFMSEEGMCDYLHHIDTKTTNDDNYGMTLGNPFNVSSYAQLADDLGDDPDFEAAVDANTPGLRPIGYPIMVGQNTRDPIVPHLDTDVLVKNLKSQGAKVTYCKTNQNAYWWATPYGKKNNHNFILRMMFKENMTDQDTDGLCDKAKVFLSKHGLSMVEND